MNASRRGVLGAFGLLPLAAAGGAVASDSGFPFKADYDFPGTYLNAAYVHPMGAFARAAGENWLQARRLDVSRKWPAASANARVSAIAKFAQLINASPADIAVVPSTMGGENLVAATLKAGNGGNGFSVVTDEYHYHDSLVLYRALYSDPYPVRIAKQRDGRIDLADIDALIDSTTKLVAVSMVSSSTGFLHDIKALCEIAHRKGALVYADIIQAVGAVPIDVKDLGVDFCCAGAYKWLLGDFGPAFLYVRPDRLKLCRRVQLGWYAIPAHAAHETHYGAPATAEAEPVLGHETANIFEVSTPAFGPLAIDDAALGFLLKTGVREIAQHRQPLIDTLQDGMLDLGCELMTPKNTRGPISTFHYPNARDKLTEALAEAKITVTLYENSIRVSPSLYNDLGDIKLFLDVVRSRSKSN